MASHIKRGESLLIPFRDGLSISDSQNKPRMYKTRQMFEKAFPKHYLGTDGVELVEYAEVKHGRWIENGDDDMDAGMWHCSECGHEINSDLALIEEMQEQGYALLCEYCGARMDEEAP